MWRQSLTVQKTTVLLMALFICGMSFFLYVRFDMQYLGYTTQPLQIYRYSTDFSVGYIGGHLSFSVVLQSYK